MGASTRKSIEVQVNPEYGEAEALSVAEKYSRAVGRLPAFLLADVDTIWIHRGVEGFGGGNRECRVTPHPNHCCSEQNIIAAFNKST